MKIKDIIVEASTGPQLKWLKPGESNRKVKLNTKKVV